MMPTSNIQIGFSWILITGKAAGKARADHGCACFVPEPGQQLTPAIVEEKANQLPPVTPTGGRIHWDISQT